MSMNAQKARFIKIIGNQRPVFGHECLDIAAHKHFPYLLAIPIASKWIDGFFHIPS
ncbi:MAG: hypothetical protein GAK38_03923 [Xylophilus sp.]|nr:MAG: hypothetical protein GAK38_03923 [Xylophilus sp.]